MNKERAKELLPVIQAFAEGKEIQYRQINYPEGEWHDTLAPTWSPNCQYRIKPEPFERWLVVNSRGTVVVAYEDVASANKGAIANFEAGPFPPYNVVHVREVEE